MANKSNPKITWGVIGVILLLLIIWAYSNNHQKSIVNSSKSNREVALTCTTDMATAFHIHPNLEIVINGQKQVIPAGIGISATCMNSLHTHDTSGQIHVESPQKRDFTLADFFAVWGQTFTQNDIIEHKVDANSTITVAVNGKSVDTYENTIMHDQDKIVINYQTK